jgi:catechol 2,3-dioxygenase-like lactoylglutathione lyase family enzyme
MQVEPRLNIVTLGVLDLTRARRFYEVGLGWRASSASQGDIVFFQLGGLVLALYPRGQLADDATVPQEGAGFRGLSFAHNVRERAQVAEVLSAAQAAGGTVVKPAQDVFWGGHSGYFADPDGHLWEVAWNPHFKLDERGGLVLPP